jgi:GT2 family glycosyltransferase
VTHSLSVVLTTIVTAVFAALVVPQVALTLWFGWIVRRRTRGFHHRNNARSVSATVPAEVILCLRDCDATLDDVFAALAGQSHQPWRLRVVVDSVDDAAWPVAQAAISRLEAEAASWQEHTIEPLACRPDRGSLKCASLRQALRSLHPETRIVALIDADSVVHPDWLLTMVDECLQPGIGAVSGNRWYDPHHDTPAAVVRAIWNAGAIVQMTTFGIPWGGSLAVRREAIDDCRWADVIETTLCEDTALATPLAETGWAYRFVPALVAVDHDDDIAFGPLIRWITRQLLTARLHHPAWPLVATHGIATSLGLVTAVAGCVWGWLTGHSATAMLFAGFVVAYECANLCLLIAVAKAVRTAISDRKALRQPLTPRRCLVWFALIPVTQAIYGLAIARSMATRWIEWRGVIYGVHGSPPTAEVRILQPSLVKPIPTPTPAH